MLHESDLDSYFVIKAKNVRGGGSVRDCYIDMSLPERISDLAFFLDGNRLDAGYHSDFDGEIICAVPIDCFGVYDIFYSKTAPQIGVDVLRKGLVDLPKNPHIAADLAYILRDEGRTSEAAEMFEIAIEADADSHFLCGELADCYAKVGEVEKSRRYREMFEQSTFPVRRGILGSIIDWFSGRSNA